MRRSGTLRKAWHGSRGTYKPTLGLGLCDRTGLATAIDVLRRDRRAIGLFRLGEQDAPWQTCHLPRGATASFPLTTDLLPLSRSLSLWDMRRDGLGSTTAVVFEETLQRSPRYTG